jgi:RNA polymerase sigma factor (sigma-70 family)
VLSALIPLPLATPWQPRTMPPALSMDVVAECRPAVLTLAARLLRRRKDDPDVEDCAHETFRRVLENPDRWEADRPLLPWVLGIARHVALDAIRANRRRSARIAPASQEQGAEEATSRLADLRESPERALHVVRSARDLERALSTLSAGEREALLLFHLEGLSYGQIAERLGVPAGTVGTWILRARQAIAKRVPGGGEQNVRGEP